VPHPDTDKSKYENIRCPDCNQITDEIQKKYLANPAACPWCDGDIQADAAADVDEGIATQDIDCLECGRSWQDMYRLEKLS